jgi:putative oxidoreductase
MLEYHPLLFQFPACVLTVEHATIERGASVAATSDHWERRTWFERLGSSTPASHELGLALVRAGFGLSLALAHGLGKLTNADGFVGGLAQRGFPLPGVFGWAAILSEFVGGLLLAIGLLTRPAAAFVLATLAVAAFYVHAADPFQRKELALAYVLVSIAVLIAGSGRFSIDALVASRFRQSARG